MGFEVYPVPAGVKVLNKSQLFTSSGTWTVPSGISNAYYVARGGNGTQPVLGWGGSNGVDGGNSSAGSVIGYGGKGGLTFYSEGNYGYSFAAGVAGQSGSTTEAFVTTTPGASVTVTVGSGVGSFVSISWAE